MSTDDPESVVVYFHGGGCGEPIATGTWVDVEGGWSHLICHRCGQMVMARADCGELDLGIIRDSSA